MTTYTDYADGTITATQAIRALCRDLGEVESQLTPLENERAGLRAAISEMLVRLDGERAEVPGFGVVKLTAAAVVEGWDSDRVGALRAYLVATSQDALVDALDGCRTQRMRAGSLRIEREKG